MVDKYSERGQQLVKTGREILSRSCDRVILPEFKAIEERGLKFAVLIRNRQQYCNSTRTWATQMKVEGTRAAMACLCRQGGKPICWLSMVNRPSKEAWAPCRPSLMTLATVLEFLARLLVQAAAWCRKYRGKHGQSSSQAEQRAPCGHNTLERLPKALA